jgi:hypothetical protein
VQDDTTNPTDVWDIGRCNNQAQSSVGSLYFIWKEKHDLKDKLFLFITTTTSDNKMIKTKQTLLN